jgi:hypothetical protein
VVRFARLIDRRVRDLGVPSARAACGGIHCLPWSPLKVEGQQIDSSRLHEDVRSLRDAMYALWC